jgi:hypothetical protein
MSDENNSIERDDARDVKETGQALDADPPSIHLDGAMLQDLGRRMRTADWTKYERGSDDFLDIENGLAQVGKASPEKANELWDSTVPKDIKKPAHLDFQPVERQAERGDSGETLTADEEHKQFEARVNKAMERGVSRVEAEALIEATQGILEEEEKRKDLFITPEVQKRYLSTVLNDKNQFYFRDKDNRLAFEDRGRRMSTQHNDPDVAKSMVELAQAKGWEKIKVTGHDDFKREVWLQAMAKGIEVSGYKPKDVDLARLEDLKKGRPLNSVEKNEDRDRNARDGKEKSRANAREFDAKEKQSSTKDAAVTGKLLEHGRAPFDFSPDNDSSYYIKVQTPEGEKTHWGKDLERAVKEGGVKVGDKVDIEYLGRQAVTVNEKVRDEGGEVIGNRPLDTHRNSWRVAPADKPQPELKGDYKVVAAVLTEVMKDQGKTPKEIDAAVKEAARVLGNKQQKGQPSPRVKMYSKEGTREKERNMPNVKTRELDKERNVGGR